MDNNLPPIDNEYTDDPYYDWVAIHAKFTAREVFGRLKDIVEKDCESAKKHVSGAIEFDEDKWPSKFAVMWRDGSRIFSCKDEKKVIVTNAQEESVVAGSVFVDGLTCKLALGGGSLLVSIPEFSKKALFGLFFPQKLTDSQLRTSRRREPITLT